MQFREEVDTRGISHLVDEKGRCLTFRDCRKHSPIRDPEEMSPMALRAALRKARIDNEILKKKLAAAEKKIQQFETSVALIEEMARDEEGTCP